MKKVLLILTTALLSLLSAIAVAKDKADKDEVQLSPFPLVIGTPNIVSRHGVEWITVEGETANYVLYCEDETALCFIPKLHHTYELSEQPVALNYECDRAAILSEGGVLRGDYCIMKKESQ